MIDENAFGLLVAYYTVEDDEYALERAEFVERFGLFRDTLLEYLREEPPGRGVWALHLGHATYLELSEEECGEPIEWLKQIRAWLDGRGFLSVAILSHGSRWVPGGEGPDLDRHAATSSATWEHASWPSEPLRRALYADAASRPEQSDEREGWGPGLYIDTEAIEAMGRKLKNAPTPLMASGATFYRMGR